MKLTLTVPVVLAVLLSGCSESATEVPAAPHSLALEESANATGHSGGGTGELIYGVSADNHLVAFRSGKPNQLVLDVAISGVASGERIVGLDFRPSDLNADGLNDVGKLYGASDAGRLYRLDPSSGVASAPVSLSSTPGGLPGGIGFNPVPDRLRIHTLSGQNLRINVDNGATIVDAPLRYGDGDANAGVAPRIAAASYTNNDNDPSTGTVLFALDAASGSLTTFPAATGGPNGGVMTTVGALGVSFSTGAGFDISLTSGTAYAALQTSPSGKSTLYAIDLATGRATALGLLAQTSSAIVSIAIEP